jgi:hypothetical protein
MTWGWSQIGLDSDLSRYNSIMKSLFLSGSKLVASNDSMRSKEFILWFDDLDNGGTLVDKYDVLVWNAYVILWSEKSDIWV